MKELETKRLKLRYLRKDDYEELFDAWSDDEVTKYLAFDTYDDIEEAKRRVAIWLEEYKDEKCLRWEIEIKEGGALFGNIDVVGIDSDGIPHIGYVSRRRYWNKGYMTEALGAVTEYLFSKGFSSVIVEAVDENTGSNRVIQKNGYRLFGHRTVEYKKRAGVKKHCVNSYRKDRNDNQKE